MEFPAVKIKKIAKSVVWMVAGVAAMALTACSSGSDCDPEESAECEVASESGAPAVTTQAVPAQALIESINHVVVVTGQSNVEAADTMFDPQLGWRVADLHQVWDENARPGNHSLTDPTRSPNNNFAFHFGKSLVTMDPDARVGFIVIAAPGEGIANWDYESPFYWKIRKKIRNALAPLPDKDTIDVMLWHQGESDSQYEGTSDPDATGFTDEDSPEYKNYYQIKLRNVINNFRSEPWAVSDLPFICGETRVSFRVNRRLVELNDDNDPNTACVKTTDLPYRLTDPSGAHFSAAGLRELGRRYMQQYLAIISG